LATKEDVAPKLQKLQDERKHVLGALCRTNNTVHTESSCCMSSILGIRFIDMTGVSDRPAAPVLSGLTTSTNDMNNPVWMPLPPM